MSKSNKHKLEQNDNDSNKHRKKIKTSKLNDIQQAHLNTEPKKINDEIKTEHAKKHQLMNKIKEIDLNSGIIDLISLKYIMTIENEANNNKIKYYSLFYDGFEYKVPQYQ